MEQKLKVSKILVMHLKSTFRRQPLLEYDIYDVAFEDETTYTLAHKSNMYHGTVQIVKKEEVNEVRYIQVFSQVDSRTYWHFNLYVYAELDEGATAESFIEFWSDELKQRAMKELKEQNQMLKDMHKGIETISK